MRKITVHLHHIVGACQYGTGHSVYISTTKTLFAGPMYDRHPSLIATCGKLFRNVPCAVRRIVVYNQDPKSCQRKTEEIRCDFWQICCLIICG